MSPLKALNVYSNSQTALEKIKKQNCGGKFTANVGYTYKGGALNNEEGARLKW